MPGDQPAKRAGDGRRCIERADPSKPCCTQALLPLFTPAAAHFPQNYTLARKDLQEHSAHAKCPCRREKSVLAANFTVFQSLG
jgi:hypothetical protein